MIYVLTEWDGKGSGFKTVMTNDKQEAIAFRECKLTREAALKKYGKNFFYGNDIKCSTIDSYTSDIAYREGETITSKNYY